MFENKMETKPSKHKVSDNELLDDLKRVAKEFGKDKISFNMYEKFGVYYGRKISKRFGSWNNAKEKAGFQLNPYATLTKEELLEDLKIVSEKVGNKYLSLGNYNKLGKYSSFLIRKYFGSFDIAKELLGLKRNTRNASNDELITDIRRVSEALGKSFFIAKEYQQLGKFGHQTISRRFSGWYEALRKAGLSIPKIATKEDFLDDLRKVANGRSFMSFKDYRKSGKFSQSKFFNAFGKWNNAKEMAGLSIPKIINYSKEEIIENLKQVANGRQYLQLNEYLLNGKYTKNDIIRTFGSWANAKRLAGLMIIVKQKITKQECINDLKKVAEKLEKDHITTFEYQEFGKYNCHTLIKRFGTWNNTLEKAGLRIKKGVRYNKEDLIDDLKKVAKDKTNITVNEYCKNGAFKYRLFLLEFGSWSKAKKKAGLERVETKDYILDELIIDVRKVAKSLNSESLTIKEYYKFGKFNYSVAYHRFGRWDSIKEKAGLKTKEQLRLMKKAILEDLIKVANGRSKLSYIEYKISGIYNIDSINKAFGSWPKAKEMAGITNGKYKGVKYTELLLDLKNVAKKLGKKNVIIKDYRAHGKFHLNLFLGAFGTWKKSLMKAGLQPSKIIQHTKEELIEDLIKVSNVRKSLTIKEYNKLGKYNSLEFWRAFGTWTKAKKMAGISFMDQIKEYNSALLIDLKRVAEKLGKENVIIKEYKKHGKFNPNVLVRAFGTWKIALQKAGLHTSKVIEHSKEELIEDIIKVANGRKDLTIHEYEQSGKYAYYEFRRAFGSWVKAKKMASLE